MLAAIEAALDAAADAACEAAVEATPVVFVRSWNESVCMMFGIVVSPVFTSCSPTWLL